MNIVFVLGYFTSRNLSKKIRPDVNSIVIPPIRVDNSIEYGMITIALQLPDDQE